MHRTKKGEKKRAETFGKGEKKMKGMGKKEKTMHVTTRRAASHKVGDGEDRWEAPDPFQGVLPQKWSKTELNRFFSFQNHLVGVVTFLTPTTGGREEPTTNGFRLRARTFSVIRGNGDYTGMWVRLGSSDLMAGKVMFLRSNQGGRLDGNESVADSFRSDLVGFKSWSARILGAFFPLTSARKSSSREANSLPDVTLPSLLFSSDKYHPCKI
ncbi:hypothetical protein TNCV_4805151 [Trichonephila clavipes]|nr:hypothetical protein TNCV_4805151 [Trichonephila clavipes]